MGGGFHIEVLGKLDHDETDAVALLVERATEVDGVRPLSEHSTLHLRHGGDPGIRHLLAYGDATGDLPQLAGFVHLDITDEVAGSSAEIVVDPAWRRQGLGRLLVDAARAETPDGRLRLWSHGENAGAAALAASMGYRKIRELRQLRRSLSAPLPPVAVPDGIDIRGFGPGKDDEAWVELNALVFADHPEQGSLTLDDLHRRMAEPWFDADGFFLAERDGRLVGYHWTKVHGGSERSPMVVHEHDGQGLHSHGGHGHDPIGEVYVVGVHPDERRTGLGTALILTGLRHLRALGLLEAMLYVDADNRPAIAAYERLGFTHWDSDVQYRSPGLPPAA
ncbi:MAG TPA: mycothiol synthase [Actinomycetes bacterium]|nr:mycothiol synthase [Actinomycetes bacterium]